MALHTARHSAAPRALVCTDRGCQRKLLVQAVLTVLPLRLLLQLALRLLPPPFPHRLPLLDHTPHLLNPERSLALLQTWWSTTRETTLTAELAIKLMADLTRRRMAEVETSQVVATMAPRA